MDASVTMKTVTEYRVVSDKDGWITEYRDRDKAKDRAQKLNQEAGVPEDHHVEDVDVRV